MLKQSRQQKAPKATKKKNMRKKAVVLLLKCLSFMVLLCYLLFVIEQHIRPIIQGLIEYECREYAMIAFHQATQTHLQNHPEGYEGLYQITYDAANVPTSLVTNSFEINALKTALAEEVMKSLAKTKQEKQGFRLGKLLGIQMFAARGPYIEIEMNPQSYVVAQIYDTLESAGTNQTKLNVYAKYSIQMNVMMAGYIQTVTVENDVLLWQTLFLGKVPDVNL